MKGSSRPPAPGEARRWVSRWGPLPPQAARAPLVLASASPRRRELLSVAGVACEVLDPGGDARPTGHGSWQAACLHALHKAAIGARGRPGRLVLAADTVVVHRGRTLGKPRDPQEAAGMLQALSGDVHHVYTAFCLALRPPGGPRPTRVLWLEVVRSRVLMRRLRPAEIAAYVASGAPLDKAGAYGIQDRAPRVVESAAGCYYNVVGLPLAAVQHALYRVGWRGGCGGLRPPVPERRSA